ncbi:MULTISPECIES: hypothetical protein [Streptomyces]|uniref:hypothetical protein n=1 Tax=Streptomyces TaxID=1883 RepID=UPI00226E190D|nr:MULTISPECIES: hypothetical protein [unclassified Streptomyces]MCY0940238.1 hypothetical protein [Streptomyces sp. H34-AA3]MCZ4080885.1 hypothetical protein [Streptomyces sp. H34-S5]
MTQEDSLLPFEQETLRRSRAVTAGLEQFTAELAPRLGLAWSHRVLPTPYRWSHADDRLWEREEGVLWRALRRDGDHQRARAFLTHAHGFQLCVIQRPHQPGEFLVGTLLPAGVYEYDTTPHPQAVSVPGDPARAAAAVQRRLLPYYRLASMRIASGTRFKQAQQITIGRSTDGRPIADVLMPRAVRALLHEDGRWHLDPGTGLCVTATNSPFTPEVLVQDAADRLRGLGFEVVLSDRHPLETYFRSQYPTSPAPVTGLPSTPPGNPGRAR